jgi:hypothetical protein
MSDDAFRTLWYLVENTCITSYITTRITDNVAQLKKAIKVKEEFELAASSLNLWKVRTFRSQL